MMSLGVEGGNAWRAVAVACLALSGFLLVRYWQSLEEYSQGARLMLVSLRAVVFLLLTGALAGVHLDYEGVVKGRVLVYDAQEAAPLPPAEAGGAQPSEAAASAEIERVTAALRSRGFEPVTETPASRAFMVEHDESFAAAVIWTDAAMSATEARREVERASARVGGAPVYVLTSAQENIGPSVALEDVQVAGRPVRGVPLMLRCMVHGRRMSGHESLVTISDSAKVQASARVRWRSDDERQAVVIEVVPKTAGWAQYFARIEAAGGEGASVLSRSLSFYVEERRMRVLFFEGEPTWEAKFIRRALEQTGLFELDYFAQVSRAAVAGSTTAETAARPAEEAGGVAAAETSEGKRSASAQASPEARLHAALASAAALGTYDAIIVGATPNALLSAAEAERLTNWVARRGGGLIILGGNSFAGSIAAPNGKLYTLLPSDVDPRSLSSETQQVARGVPLEAERPGSLRALVPTEAGAVGPLRGYMSAEEGARAEALSGQGFSLRAARPGAVVLARVGPPDSSGTSSAGDPLITAMRYGAGRVMLFAPADSWRIRTNASGAQDDTAGPFGALWQGLTLWATEGARPQVEIVLDKESPALGQEVTAEIRLRDRSYAPLKLERVKAGLQPLETGEAGEVVTVAGSVQEILFTPDQSDQSVWRARFRTPALGQFSLEADYLSGRETGSTEKRFAVVAPGRSEAGASGDALRRTARERKGDLFTADQMNALLERLSAPSTQAPERVVRAFELRTWWPLALILPLLLSAEWLLQRMRDEG
ncbi:MAG TPA: hypothetical protein VF544_15095 [Pyrinomonadaceae bacterium]